MASKVTMTFKKGDDVTHHFQLPLDEYTVGGTLYFTAKPAIDNDNTDAAAVIDKSFDDTVVTVGDVHADWLLEFAPSDIENVNFTNGEKAKKYLGEFQYVDNDGKVHSFPNDDNFIEVIIYADVKRATS